MATDISKVVFDSRYLYFKQLTTGTGSTTISTSAAKTFSVSHGLGYNPNTLIYSSIDGSTWYRGYHLYKNVNTGFDLSVMPYTTASSAVILMSPTSTGPGSWTNPATVNIRYTVYEDSSE